MNTQVDKYAATRCQDCDMAKHVCDLLRMQRDRCCPRCAHPAPTSGNRG